MPKRSMVRSGVWSGSSGVFHRPITMRLWGRCRRTRWQMARAWEKAKGGRAEMKMTVLGSLASDSRISVETEPPGRWMVWWWARSMIWTSMWVVSSSA